LFSSQEKEIYDNLIRIVGSEMDIRIRQNAILIMDKIFNKVNSKVISISSGSLAEGLDLPGSDIDVMFVLIAVQVIQNLQHMNKAFR
jgi:DNA polymerase sigma